MVPEEDCLIILVGISATNKEKKENNIKLDDKREKNENVLQDGEQSYQSNTPDGACTFMQH